jgi:hypothetical protein
VITEVPADAVISNVAHLCVVEFNVTLDETDRYSSGKNVLAGKVTLPLVSNWTLPDIYGATTEALDNDALDSEALVSKALEREALVISLLNENVFVAVEYDNEPLFVPPVETKCSPLKETEFIRSILSPVPAMLMLAVAPS